MTSQEWCDHCDLPLDQCAHAAPQSEVKEQALSDPIFASAHTDCPLCLDSIRPHEQIVRTRHGWAHMRHTQSARSVFDL